jgi:hypothetical protein
MRTNWKHSSVLAALWAAGVIAFPACDSPTESRVRVPVELQLVKRDTQTAIVGQLLADSLEVRVLNSHQEPIPEIDVEFASTAGEGALSPGTARTDAQGIARAAWTLGLAAGEQKAEARLPGRSVAPAVFIARALPEAPAELVKVSGDEQTGTVGEPLPEPLVVQVRDAHGNGVPGAEVRWSARQGTVMPEVDSTDTSGFSHSVWTLGIQGLRQDARAVRLLDLAGAGAGRINNLGQIILNVGARAYLLTPTP